MSILLKFLSLTCALLFVSACAMGGSAGMGRNIEFQLNESLTLVVRDLTASEDGYRVVVGFKENTEHQHVIQEVSASNSTGLRYSIVESFRTSLPLLSPRRKGIQASEWDIHSAVGISGWEHRSMSIYAGDIQGANNNVLGFAMLSKNIDGTMVTHVPKYVNSSYQKQHAIEGEVVARHQESSNYEIYWQPNKIILMTPSGGMVYEKGKGTRLIDSAATPLAQQH